MEVWTHQIFFKWGNLMMNPSIAGFWGGNIDCYLKNMGLYCFRMVVWKIWRNEDLKYGDSAHIAGSTSRMSGS